MTDDQLLIRANEARQLLESSLLQEALDHYEQEIIQAWKTSPLRDEEGQRKLRLMLDAQAKFRSYLTNTLQSGKLAKVIEPTITDRVMSMVGRR